MVAWLAVVALAAAGTFWLIHRSLVDDAYITLAYAQNLAFDGRWGLNSDEVSNSATSPLNVALLALLTVVLRQPVVAAGVLFVITFVLVAYWSARTAREVDAGRLLPVLAVILLLVNPLLLSTVGLETYLALALVSGLAYFATRGSAVPVGVIGGLLILTRLDLVVFVVVAVFGVSKLRVRWLTSALVASAIVAPWFVFSWFALGSAIPDTFVSKTLESSWGGATFANGMYFLWTWMPESAFLAFIPAFAGMAALLVTLVACWTTGARDGHRRAPAELVVVLGLGGIAHFMSFSLIGTPPYQWYYGPSVGALSLFLAASLSLGWRISGRMGAPRVIASSAVALVGALVLASIVAAIRGPVPWRYAPMMQNWAFPGEYARVAQEISAIAPGAVVQSPGEIGTLAFFCNCSLVDPFSDRAQFLRYLDRREEVAGPVMSWVLKLNYRNLDRKQRPVPVDYTLTTQAPADVAGVREWRIHTSAEFGIERRLVLLPAEN